MAKAPAAAPALLMGWREFRGEAEHNRELQGRICTETLKGRRDGSENKRSSTPRFNLGLRQS